MYNSITFPDKAKEIKTEENSKYVTSLKQSWRKTFQKQIGCI